MSMVGWAGIELFTEKHILLQCICLCILQIDSSVEAYTIIYGILSYTLLLIVQLACGTYLSNKVIMVLLNLGTLTTAGG